MPKYEHDNWGDISNTIFAKGIITAIDSDNDTADVTVKGYQNGEDIPLFYNCSPDAEERDNGAIEGAAAAFSAGTEDDPEDGDEVIVMCEADTGNPIRIIGFVEGIKSCCGLYHEPWDEWCSSENTWRVSLETALATTTAYCNDPTFGTTGSLPSQISIDGSFNFSHTSTGSYLNDRDELSVSTDFFLFADDGSYSYNNFKYKYLYINVTDATFSGKFEPALSCFIRFNHKFRKLDETLSTISMYFAFWQHGIEEEDLTLYLGPGKYAFLLDDGNVVTPSHGFASDLTIYIYPGYDQESGHLSVTSCTFSWDDLKLYCPTDDEIAKFVQISGKPDGWYTVED